MRPIGDGTFGTVLKAVNIHTGEVVIYFICLYNKIGCD